MSRETILIIDDESDIRAQIRDILSDHGYRILQADSASVARKLVRQQSVDLALLDIWMPGEDGMSLLRSWRHDDTPEFPILVMSGHGNIETALEATRLGAWHYLEKPFAMDKLLLSVTRALETYRLRRQNRALSMDSAATEQLVGDSPEIRRLREQAQAFGDSGNPVLILGEPGCEFLALANHIHYNGVRHHWQLVIGNGQNLNQRLLEETPGNGTCLLLEAHGGTLFMNPLDQLTVKTQRRLLSVLENHHLLQANGTATPIDVQLIATLHQRPEAALASNILDASLYAQLAPYTLTLPPLRERAQDIPGLVEHYAARYCARENLPMRSFPSSVMETLRKYDWPDNVHELRRLVYQLLISGDGAEVGLAEINHLLHPVPQADAPPGGLENLMALPYREARTRFEQMYYQFQIEQSGGSMKRLSDSTHMERTYLYRKLRDLGIERPRESSS